MWSKVLTLKSTSRDKIDCNNFDISNEKLSASSQHYPLYQRLTFRNKNVKSFAYKVISVPRQERRKRPFKRRCSFIAPVSLSMQTTGRYSGFIKRAEEMRQRRIISQWQSSDCHENLLPNVNVILPSPHSVEDGGISKVQS